MPDIETTKELIEEFQNNFGEDHYHFALHAAIPAVLTADMLHSIRENFFYQKNIFPWECVSDLLLSPLCNMVAYGVYEMKLEIRQILINKLKEDESLGPARIKDLSAFLNKQIEQLKYSVTKQDKEIYRSQFWAANVYDKSPLVINDFTNLLPQQESDYDKKILKTADRLNALSKFILAINDGQYQQEYENIIRFTNKIIDFVKQPSNRGLELDYAEINEKTVLIPKERAPKDVSTDYDSYTGAFQYDIFISYSHNDNRPTSFEDVPWVEKFYKDLQMLIIRRIGRADALKIFWDNQKFGEPGFFPESIESAVKQSAIMLCLLSPSYLSSDYCNKELQSFYNNTKRDRIGTIVNNRSRLLNVLLYNIPYTDWPREFANTAGFYFNDAETRDDRGTPYELSGSQYRSRMFDLVDAVIKTLDDIKYELIDSPGAAGSSNIKAFTIYFGDVADSLRSIFKRIVSVLKKEEFEVSSGIPPPYELVEHQEVIKDKIRKANLCIHLLDEYPGKEIEGDPKKRGYPQRQAELSLEYAESTVIWIPRDLNIADIEDEGYRGFLYSLEVGSHPGKGLTFIRGTKSTLVQDIIERAEMLKKTTEDSRREKSVLIDTHYNDQLNALELYKVCLENGIKVYLNPQDGDPKTNLNTFAEHLSKVNQVVFLYGKISKEWILGRMNAALKIIIEKDLKVKSFYVFLLPPEKNSSEIFFDQRLVTVKVINISKGSDISEFQQLINEMQLST